MPSDAPRRAPSDQAGGPGPGLEHTRRAGTPSDAYQIEFSTEKSLDRAPTTSPPASSPPSSKHSLKTATRRAGRFFDRARTEIGSRERRDYGTTAGEQRVEELPRAIIQSRSSPAAPSRRRGAGLEYHGAGPTRPIDDAIRMGGGPPYSLRVDPSSCRSSNASTAGSLVVVSSVQAQMNVAAVQLSSQLGRRQYENLEFHYVTKHRVAILTRLNERESAYDGWFGIFILLNMLVLGIETDVMRLDEGEVLEAKYLVLNPFFFFEIIFFGVFCCELWLRWRLLSEKKEALHDIVQEKRRNSLSFSQVGTSRGLLQAETKPVDSSSNIMGDNCEKSSSNPANKLSPPVLMIAGSPTDDVQNAEAGMISGDEQTLQQISGEPDALFLPLSSSAAAAKARKELFAMRSGSGWSTISRKNFALEDADEKMALFGQLWKRQAEKRRERMEKVREEVV